MKTRKIRLLSALLALAMLFALMPTAAFAEDPTKVYNCGKNGAEVIATLDTVTGIMTISGTGAMADYNYGDHYNDQPWVDQRTSITRVVVEGSVTTIGMGAFHGCTELIEADMSNALNLEIIGQYAFSDCMSLKTVKLPQKGSLKTIDYNAFSFYYNDGSEANALQIEEIIIPASVEKICNYMFDGCSKLTKVIFESPSKLNDVKPWAFRNCSNAKIYCEDGLKERLSEMVFDANNIFLLDALNPVVTFDVDGNVVAEQNTKDNHFKADRPETPTKKGYQFTGWYTKDDNDKYELFDFNTPITDNIILYAQWEKVPVDTYVVTVENGVAWVEADAETEAVAAGESICVPEGATVHVKADETAFDGMAFERWEVRKGNVELENDRAAKTSFTMPAGEVQLEAMPRLESPDDSGWDAATVVTGAVIGTGTAILAYHIGMEVYAEQVLGKDVAVPRTRGEVALLAWQLAGSPEPNAAFTLLTDEAKAQQWAVESGLMQPDAEGNFNGTKKMSKWKALRTLDAAKKQV